MELLQKQLETVAQYIIKTGTRETSSGNWITYADDVPNLISEDLFRKHIHEIATLCEDDISVADVEVCEANGSIDIVHYLDFCPNYEPWPEEEEEEDE